MTLSFVSLCPQEAFLNVFAHFISSVGASCCLIFSCVSLVREDSGLENAKKILTKLGLAWDLVDACVVRLVCDTVSSRSARLCAAALATIANRIRVNHGMDHLETTVGVDGTVYRKQVRGNKKEKIDRTNNKKVTFN